MTTPYVYRLTDLHTGIQYIGSRYAKGCHPTELGVTYFTSSSHVTNIYKSNPARFKSEILVVSDRDYVIKVEKSIIDFNDAVMSEMYYNRTNNRAIHPDDAKRGGFKAHLIKNSSGLSVSAVNAGNSNVKTGWAYELGRRAVESGRLKAGSSEAGKKGGKIGGPKGCRITNSTYYRCGECDLVTTIGPLTRHHKTCNHFGKVLVKKGK